MRRSAADKCCPTRNRGLCFAPQSSQAPLSRRTARLSGWRGMELLTRPPRLAAWIKFRHSPANGVSRRPDVLATGPYAEAVLEVGNQPHELPPSHSEISVALPLVEARICLGMVMVIRPRAAITVAHPMWRSFREQSRRHLRSLPHGHATDPSGQQRGPRSALRLCTGQDSRAP